MKFGLKLFVATLALGTSQIAASQDDVANVLDVVNQHGVTECNGLIRENLKFGPNWYINITSYSHDLGPQIETVTINTMSGNYGDSLKYQQTYLQTPQTCALTDILTVTMDKSCHEVVESDWSRVSAVPNTDYVFYKTATGVEAYLKDQASSVGSPSCLVDYQRRITQNR